MSAKEEEVSFFVKLKYYTTLTLGTTACVSSFVFMFMIPWVLDPSISTLMADFVDEPVVCKTVYSEQREGNTNCSWSSCREGCTKDLYECDMIYVSYMNTPYIEDELIEEPSEDNPDVVWLWQGAPLLINIKGCVYPKEVNCSLFSMTYGAEGEYFPCYYSRVDPNLVITNYSYASEVQSLCMALFVPNVLSGVSLIIISYWWYPGCQKRRCQYQIPPDQEKASIHTANDDDEEDENSDTDDEEEKGPLQKSDRVSIRKGITPQDEEKEVDTAIHMQEM